MSGQNVSNASFDKSSLSGFALRGVVEGYYGPVWTLEQRIGLVRFIARHRMNFYGYSPKDDPFCRHAWDSLLPDDRLVDLRKLVEVGQQSRVSIAFGLAPGISICYSDKRDRDRLIAKYRQAASVGVRHFLLLFDDIPNYLQHLRDQAAYESLADAHADLTNFVYGSLVSEFPAAELMVCPTVYCGRGDESHVRQLGWLLDKHIDIFWTGRTVWSNEIDSRDAQYFCEQVGRPPLYWDNYPANDLFMSNQMHIGPYRGRDRDLHKHSRGVLVNPMTQCECSKIPLATIGDYLWNPEGYDPEASWRQAILEIVGPRDAEAFQLFADNVRSSCLELAESPLLTTVFEKLRFASRRGPAVGEWKEATDFLESFIRASEALLAPQVDNAVLAAEIRPWVVEFQRNSVLLLDALWTGHMPQPVPNGRPNVFSSLALADLLPDVVPNGRWHKLSDQ